MALLRDLSAFREAPSAALWACFEAAASQPSALSTGVAPAPPRTPPSLSASGRRRNPKALSPRERLIASGCIDAACDAAAAHPDSADVAAAACAVLALLLEVPTPASDAMVEVYRRSGVLVLETMQRFPGNAGAQRRACALLCALVAAAGGDAVGGGAMHGLSRALAMHSSAPEVVEARPLACCVCHFTSPLGSDSV